jgi:hypothetical protein
LCRRDEGPYTLRYHPAELMAMSFWPQHLTTPPRHLARLELQGCKFEKALRGRSGLLLFHDKKFTF